jgi:D-serine deaminase-like pyridoxal phosphate-dependent protein
MNATFQHLETPVAILDVAKMTRNIERMQQRMSALGVKFRPHVKTSKCVQIAQRQRDAGAQGITVSTLKEAEEFFAAGFVDILYAVCIPPSKIGHALALRQRGCALQILVDSVAAADAVVKIGKETKHTFDVLIEIDTDGHRSGIGPSTAVLVEVGQTLHHGGANLRGVMTHAGSTTSHRRARTRRHCSRRTKIACRRSTLPGRQRRLDTNGAFGHAT